MPNTIQIEGAKQLEARLKALPAKVSGKIGRQALRAGAKDIQSPAVQHAPRKSGLLASTIKVRAARRSRGKIGAVVQTGQGFFRGKTFYGAFEEFGWRVGRRALGQSRRQVEGKHYMLHAFEAQKAAALETIKTELAAGIERAT
jgi:HK97 gp10 family phage protein